MLSGRVCLYPGVFVKNQGLGIGEGRILADRRGAAQASTGCAAQDTVRMHHMNVLLVAALGTFTGSRTRH
jgi:hypothetical protein